MVSGLDSSANGICQKPLLASNLLKTAAPANCAKVSSTLGIGWTSRSTLSLSGLRSTQMRTAPLGLGTTTMPAHHGVGSSTLEMTPRFSIRCNSSLTFWRSGMGTLRGVYIACGWAPSRNFFAKVPQTFKHPLKLLMNL